MAGEDQQVSVTSEYDDPELLEQLGEGGETPDLPAVDADPDAAPANDTPAAGEEEPAKAEQPAGDEPWRAHVKEGESVEQALARAAQERDENHGWATRVTKEMRDLRAEMREQQERLRPIIDGIQRAQQQRLEAARKAQQPDPETEPDKAILHELQQAREERAREREEAERAAEDRAWQEFDQGNASELIAALDADPDFASAHDTIIRSAYASLKRDNPDADPETLLEAVEKMEKIYLRQVKQGNKNLIEETKARAAEVFNWKPEPAQPAAATAPAGEGEVEKLRRQAAKREAARGITALGGSTSRASAAAASLEGMTDEDVFLALEQGHISERDLLDGLVSTLS